MQQNKITPLEQLRLEKLKLKNLYLADEKRIAEDWEYLTNNIGTLAFNSILKEAKDMFFGGSKKSFSLPKIGENNNFMGILTASLPLVWDIAQPVLFGYAVKKIKSFFSFKKKKKTKKD